MISTSFAFAPEPYASKKNEAGRQAEGGKQHTSESFQLAYTRTLTLWKIPFEEKNIQTRFGNAHIIVSGKADAEPLVLLHGMNASSTMWYPNIKSLSDHFRVYAIDFLLEPGRSSYTEEVKNLEQILTWYDEIFEQLKLKKINLLGASKGGWLSVNIALHSLSRINKIVLLSPAQTFTSIRPHRKVLSAIATFAFTEKKRFQKKLKMMTANINNIDPLYIDQLHIATKEAEMHRDVLEMIPFSDEQLKVLNKPVLVLIGDDDVMNDDKSLERAQLIPGVKTETIRNAGHFLSIDQAEEINKKMLDFLRSDPSVKK